MPPALGYWSTNVLQMISWTVEPWLISIGSRANGLAHSWMDKWQMGKGGNINTKQILCKLHTDKTSATYTQADRLSYNTCSVQNLQNRSSSQVCVWILNMFYKDISFRYSGWPASRDSSIILHKVSASTSAWYVPTPIHWPLSPAALPQISGSVVCVAHRKERVLRLERWSIAETTKFLGSSNLIAGCTESCIFRCRCQTSSVHLQKKHMPKQYFKKISEPFQMSKVHYFLCWSDLSQLTYFFVISGWKSTCDHCVSTCRSNLLLCSFKIPFGLLTLW